MKAAPVIAAAKQDQGNPIPGDVQRLVYRATIDELAAMWPATLYASDGFICPVCDDGARTPGRLLDRSIATVVDDLTWTCAGRMVVPEMWAEPTYRAKCNGGTIYQLRRLVLEDRDALNRFLEESAVTL